MEKEKQVAKENSPPEKNNPDIDDIIRKIKKTCLVYFKLPFYMRKLIENKNSVKSQYLATKKEEKRIEYMTLFDAVDKELRLHQYRLYREENPDFFMGPEERRLLTNLPDYIEKLIKRNVKNRLCYIATGDHYYKIHYNGIKNAIKTLVAAMDARFRYDIVIDLDYETIKSIHKHKPL